MAIRLPKRLVATEGLTKREKLVVMKERQRLMAIEVIRLLEREGFILGESLRVRGGYAFAATHEGKRTTIGIKTSADRWVGVLPDDSGGWGLLSRVKKLFVVTFDERLMPNGFDPKRLHVYCFDPKAVIAMAEKVYKRSEELGQTGFHWLPLDEDKASAATSRSAGHLLPHGELFVDEPIEWIPEDPDSEMAGAADSDAEHAESVPARLTIAQAKAGLAASFGVSPDAIKITIEG